MPATMGTTSTSFRGQAFDVLFHSGNVPTVSHKYVSAVHATNAPSAEHATTGATNAPSAEHATTGATTTHIRGQALEKDRGHDVLLHSHDEPTDKSGHVSTKYIPRLRGGAPQDQEWHGTTNALTTSTNTPQKRKQEAVVDCKASRLKVTGTNMEQDTNKDKSPPVSPNVSPPDTPVSPLDSNTNKSPPVSPNALDAALPQPDNFGCLSAEQFTKLAIAASGTSPDPDATQFFKRFFRQVSDLYPKNQNEFRHIAYGEHFAIDIEDIYEYVDGKHLGTNIGSIDALKNRRSMMIGSNTFTMIPLAQQLGVNWLCDVLPELNLDLNIRDKRGNTLATDFEKHHMSLRSLGGSDHEDNIELLRLPNHLLAHLFTFLAFPCFATASGLLTFVTLTVEGRRRRGWTKETAKDYVNQQGFQQVIDIAADVAYRGRPQPRPGQQQRDGIDGFYSTKGHFIPFTNSNVWDLIRKHRRGVLNRRKNPERNPVPEYTLKEMEILWASDTTEVHSTLVRVRMGEAKARALGWDPKTDAAEPKRPFMSRRALQREKSNAVERFEATVDGMHLLSKTYGTEGKRQSRGQQHDHNYTPMEQEIILYGMPKTHDKATALKRMLSKAKELNYPEADVEERRPWVAATPPPRDVSNPTLYDATHEGMLLLVEKWRRENKRNYNKQSHDHMYTLMVQTILRIPNHDPKSMAKDKRATAMLKKAQELGYPESDPGKTFDWMTFAAIKKMEEARDT